MFPLAEKVPDVLEKAVIFKSLPLTSNFPPDRRSEISRGEKDVTLSTPVMVIFLRSSIVSVCGRASAAPPRSR